MYRPDGIYWPKEMINSKTRILDAAERVVLREGPAHLTLDAVAAEASLSKGGVLYHFASKDDLIHGMVARLIEQFERELEQHCEADPKEAGRKTRAYLDGLLSPVSQNLPPESDRICAALLAAVVSSPSLLDPVREQFRVWQARVVNDGLDPVTATVVRLASDGLWLAELLGLPPLEPKLRDLVIARLRLLTENI